MSLAGRMDYPKWRKDRCRDCAAGVMSSGRSHVQVFGPTTSDIEVSPCTAPTEAEYIAELEYELSETRRQADIVKQNALTILAMKQSSEDDLERQLAEARKLAFFEIRRDDEAAVFVGHCPLLKICSQGETWEEAVEVIKSAVVQHVSTMESLHVEGCKLADKYGAALKAIRALSFQSCPAAQKWREAREIAQNATTSTAWRFAVLPGQALQAHDDALLDKCAAIADELSSFKSQIGPQHGMGVCWAAKTIRDKIRALKEGQ